MIPDTPDFTTYDHSIRSNALKEMRILLGDNFIENYKPIWIKKGKFPCSFNFGYEFEKSNTKLKGIIVEIDTPTYFFEMNNRNFIAQNANKKIDKMQKAIINGFMIIRVFIYDINKSICRQKIEHLKTITPDYDMYKSFDWVPSDYQQVNSKYQIYEESLKRAIPEFYHVKPCDLFAFAINKIPVILDEQLIIKPNLKKMTPNEKTFFSWLEKYYPNQFTWQFSPDWAINKGYQLRYDFVHKSIKFIIELDGEEHFSDEKNIQQDFLKNKLAINNDYKIMRMPQDFIFDTNHDMDVRREMLKVIIEKTLNNIITDRFITFPSRLKFVNDIFENHKQKLLTINIDLYFSNELTIIYKNANLKDDATFFPTYFTCNGGKKEKIEKKPKIRIKQNNAHQTIDTKSILYTDLVEWLNTTFTNSNNSKILETADHMESPLWENHLKLDCFQGNGRKRGYTAGSTKLKILIKVDIYLFIETTHESTKILEKEKDTLSIQNGYTCIHLDYDLLNKRDDWKTTLKTIIDNIIDGTETKKLIWLPTGIEKHDNIYQQLEKEIIENMIAQ